MMYFLDERAAEMPLVLKKPLVLSEKHESPLESTLVL
jgi:hypothetical protein